MTKKILLVLSNINRPTLYLSTEFESSKSDKYPPTPPLALNVQSNVNRKQNKVDSHLPS